MTRLATQPDLEHTQSLDYEWDLPYDEPDDYPCDLLTSYAFDIHKHTRSIETLEQTNRAFGEEILTMKRQLHDLAATIADHQVEETFNAPDDSFF